MSASLTEHQLRRWLYPPTDSKILPEETLKDLKLELLSVSRMYRNVPTMDIDKWVVFGMSKQDFIAKIYNRLYNQISYTVDCLLDKIVNSYEEGL